MMIDLSYRNLNLRSEFGVSMDIQSIEISPADWIFMDVVFSKNQAWINFVELGTCKGLTALYFGVVASLRSGLVTTFDNEDKTPDWIRRVWPKNVEFIKMDVLSSVQSRVVDVISQPNTFVFFDNGDKPAETKMYSPYLQRGSGFITHDFPTHWQESDIMPLPDGFEPFMNDTAAELGSACRCYIRR